MTRRDLFQRLIGAPLAAAGILLNRPTGIVYWTKTIFHLPNEQRMFNSPPRITRDPKVIKYVQDYALRGWVKFDGPYAVDPEGVLATHSSKTFWRYVHD